MTGTIPDTLPVFLLACESFTDETLDTMAASWGLNASDFRRCGAMFRATVRSRTMDVNQHTGVVWMADSAQLGIVPDLQPRLLETDTAVAAAARLLGTAYPEWLQRRDRRIVTGLCADRGTRAAVVRRGDPRRNLCLDRYVSLQRSVVVSPDTRAPVIDGAYRSAVTFGADGAPAHLQFARCRLDSTWMARARSTDDVRSEYLAACRTFECVEIEEMTLAYEHRGHGATSYLYPVWEISACGVAGSRRTRLPRARLAAAEFVPPEAPARTTTPACGTPETRRPLRNTGPRPSGSTVGVWWDSRVGLSSETHAQQLLDELTARGWSTTCNWGNDDAFESDWVSEATDWVETVDLAYYAGHASSRGWDLRPLSEAPLDFVKVGEKDTRHMLFGGAGRLKTIAICGCGPLQDACIRYSRGDVFRWNGAFDGLHIMLGFGSRIGDLPDLGRDFVTLAGDGTPIIDAWFRAVRQSSGTAGDWPAAMYAFAGAVNNPRRDHLPGCGPIARTSERPDTFVAIWAPT